MIADNHPNLVVLPVNDQALGMQNLQTTIGVIAGMEQDAGYQMRSVVIALGSDPAEIEARLAKLAAKPRHLTLSQPIGWHRTLLHMPCNRASWSGNLSRKRHMCATFWLKCFCDWTYHGKYRFG